MRKLRNKTNKLAKIRRSIHFTERQVRTNHLKSWPIWEEVPPKTT